MPEDDAPVWLVDGFRELPGNPRNAIDAHLRPHTEDPIATAAIAYAVIYHAGVSSAQDAEDMTKAAEAGYRFVLPHLNGQWNQYPQLKDRILTAVEKLGTPWGVDISPPVRTLTDGGRHEAAAALFVKLARESRDPKLVAADAIAEYKSAYDTLRDWLTSNGESYDELSTTAKTLKARLTGVSTSVDQLDDNISEEAAAKFASQYELASREDGRRSMWALIGTYVLFCVALGSAFWFALHAFAAEGELDWPSTFAHTTLSLAFLALAGFTARLSREYRQAMWHWRHTALQLRMFFPFIETLGEDEKTEVVVGMVPRFFPGQPDHPIRESNQSGSDGSDSALSEALVTEVARLATTRNAPGSPLP